MALSDPFSLAAYTFDYPETLVAKTPATPPEAARLFQVRGEQHTHHHVRDLPGLLPPNTLVVVNDAKVFPARIKAARKSGGKAEVLLLSAPDSRGEAPALLKPGRRLKDGERLVLNEEDAVEILPGEPGKRRVRLLAVDPMEWLHLHGSVPLPPYIPDDPTVYDRYQTAFARDPLAVAAPTAGLHLSPAVLKGLQEAGHTLATVTLAVGYGTFAPVEVDDVREHTMHTEWYNLSETTVALVNDWRATKRPILAVGTTALRALESAFDGTTVHPGEAWTDIYLTPANPPRLGLSLMTNFHLPHTSLLVLLASVLPGWRAAYDEAIAQGYRLFSFGDTMVIHAATPP